MARNPPNPSLALIRKRRARLVEALQSGTYRKGRGYLLQPSRGERSKARPSYCCLGVGCELAKPSVQGEWLPSEAFSPRSMQFKCPGDAAKSGSMPEPVRDYYGFRTADGHMDGDWLDHLPPQLRTLINRRRNNDFGHTLTLVGCNDDWNLSLPIIGQIIAAEPPGLFVR